MNLIILWPIFPILIDQYCQLSCLVAVQFDNFTSIYEKKVNDVARYPIIIEYPETSTLERKHVNFSVGNCFDAFETKYTTFVPEATVSNKSHPASGGILLDHSPLKFNPFHITNHKIYFSLAENSNSSFNEVSKVVIESENFPTYVRSDEKDLSQAVIHNRTGLVILLWAIPTFYKATLAGFNCICLFIVLLTGKMQKKMRNWWDARRIHFKW